MGHPPVAVNAASSVPAASSGVTNSSPSSMIATRPYTRWRNRTAAISALGREAISSRVLPSASGAKSANAALSAADDGSSSSTHPSKRGVRHRPRTDSRRRDLQAPAPARNQMTGSRTAANLRSRRAVRRSSASVGSRGLGMLRSMGATVNTRSGRRHAHPARAPTQCRI